MKRFLIADDHTFVRYALKNILLGTYLQAEIGEAASAEELLQKLIQDSWDVVITDISMPGRSGLEILHDIRTAYPKLPVLVLSMHREELYGWRVIKAGGSGYLKKEVAVHELVNAVDTVLQGKKYITPAVSEQLALSVENDGDNPHENLSDREFEIMKLLAAGVSLTAIAEQFSLGITTVSTYRTRILKKMNVQSNADLLQYAIAHPSYESMLLSAL